jgi:hypothetical protein
MKSKKLVASIVAAGALAVAVPASASAGGGGFGPGGLPANHPDGPFTGAQWGAAVSAAAPGGFIGCHASGGQAATCPDEE